MTGYPWSSDKVPKRTQKAEARSAGFEPGSDGAIPEQAIAAYNQTHPDRPY
jgi:hypothetical protein